MLTGSRLYTRRSASRFAANSAQSPTATARALLNPDHLDPGGTHGDPNAGAPDPV